MNIAFDIDNTILDLNDKPKQWVISLIKQLSKNHNVIIWSGCGLDYTLMRIRQLKLEEYVSAEWKSKNLTIDVCFDDQDVDLARLNIKL